VYQNYWLKIAKQWFYKRDDIKNYQKKQIISITNIKHWSVV